MGTLEYYNENAQDFFDNTFNANMEDIYKKFMRYLDEKSKLLDAGCGSGRDSLYFINNGFSVTAIDASEEIVKVSNEHTGINVILLNFYDLKYKNEFDAIWASASLLHINKIDISNIIDKFLLALKENGIFYMSFKYGEFEIERNGRYFNYYTEESIKALLRDKNIEILDLWITPDVREDRKDENWLNIIIKK